MEKRIPQAREKSTNEGIINGSSMLPFNHDYEDNDGIGRSYECSFCKRGFTNAQALGGHMNIHRKDKLAKSGQPSNYNTSSSSYSFPSNNYMPREDQHSYHRHHNNNNINSSNYTGIRLPSSRNHLGSQTNYPSVFNYSCPDPPTVPNFISRSSYPHGCHHGYSNYDGSAHLSLWVGSTRKTEDGDHNEMKNDGSGEPLDLELRLGCNP